MEVIRKPKLRSLSHLVRTEEVGFIKFYSNFCILIAMNQGKQWKQKMGMVVVMMVMIRNTTYMKHLKVSTEAH